jgi:hypothetical protein
MTEYSELSGVALSSLGGNLEPIVNFGFTIFVELILYLIQVETFSVILRLKDEIV